MKKLFGLGCLLLLAAGCSDEVDSAGHNGKTVDITATLEGGRTWTDGATVYINSEERRIEQGAGTPTVTLTKIEKADHYAGAYDTDGQKIVGGTLTLTLPEVQTGGEIFRPAVASSATTRLTFRELLGEFRLPVTGDVTLTRVEISSGNGEKLSGKIRVDLNSEGAPVVEGTSAASPMVVFDCGSGLDLGTSPTNISCMIPAGSYEKGFLVTLYENDKQMMTYTIDSKVEIRGGETTTLNRVEYEPDEAPSVEVTATLEASSWAGSQTWPETASLSVNGRTTMIRSGANTASAKFGPVTETDSYYAFAPISAFTSAGGGEIRAELPSTYNYTASLLEINPVAATSSNLTLACKWVAGAARVKVTGDRKIVSAQLTNNGNARISGKCDIAFENGAPVCYARSDASKSVTVKSTAGVDASKGAEFTFILIPGTYSDGLTLLLTDDKGAEFEHTIASATITRNTLTQLGQVEWSGETGNANNLSRNGKANCYMVHTAGTYSFDTKRVDGSSINDIASADWLWVSRIGDSKNNELISAVSYADGCITFTASEKKGNALIAAFNAAGEVVWSWHIWMTDAPATIDYDNNGKYGGYYVMDRHLGATSAEIGSAETYGLLYQWGRKDPFIGGQGNETADETFRNGSQTICNTKYTVAKWQAENGTAANGTIAFATAHPMFFLSGNETSNQSIWLAEGEFPKYMQADEGMWRPFQKTEYDPCPPGYQVPRNGAYGLFSNANVTRHKTGTYGFIGKVDEGVTTWFPAQGYRSAHPSDVGALRKENGEDGYSYCWSSEIQVTRRSHVFSIEWPMSYPSNDSPWGNGYPVRCVKEYHYN